MTGHKEHVTDINETRLSLKQSASITDRPMLLAYGLRDAPGQEFEEYVTDIHEARAHLRGKADMVVWATLYDQQGDEIADQQVLL